MVQLLIGKLRPLEVQGIQLSGKHLASLASAYVSAVNQGMLHPMCLHWSLTDILFLRVHVDAVHASGACCDLVSA